MATECPQHCRRALGVRLDGGAYGRLAELRKDVDVYVVVTGIVSRESKKTTSGRGVGAVRSSRQSLGLADRVHGRVAELCLDDLKEVIHAPGPFTRIVTRRGANDPAPGSARGKQGNVGMGGPAGEDPSDDLNAVSCQPFVTSYARGTPRASSKAPGYLVVDDH